MAVVGLLKGISCPKPKILIITGKKCETCTLTIPSIQLFALDSVAFQVIAVYYTGIHLRLGEDDFFYSMVLVLVKSIEDCGQWS